MADNALTVGQEDKYPIALSIMEEKASKFGLHFFWNKTKTQNIRCRLAPCPVTVNGSLTP